MLLLPCIWRDKATFTMKVLVTRLFGRTRTRTFNNPSTFLKRSISIVHSDELVQCSQKLFSLQQVLPGSDWGVDLIVIMGQLGQ